MDQRNSYGRNIIKSDPYRYIRKLAYKSIYVAGILFLVLILRQLNFKITNKFLLVIRESINYEFTMEKDGEKVIQKTKEVVDGSMDSLMVFNFMKKEKYGPPVEGEVYRIYDKSKNDGIDIISMEEEPQSISAGIVKEVQVKDKQGYFVTISHNKMEFIYGYLSKIYVSEGDTIEPGDLIGILGTNKDGNKYLRMEIKVDGILVDPLDYVDIY